MAKMSDYTNYSPQDVRRMIREGKWDRPTSGMCVGYVQTNLIILLGRDRSVSLRAE